MLRCAGCKCVWPHSLLRTTLSPHAGWSSEIPNSSPTLGWFDFQTRGHHHASCWPARACARPPALSPPVPRVRRALADSLDASQRAIMSGVDRCDDGGCVGQGVVAPPDQDLRSRVTHVDTPVKGSRDAGQRPHTSQHISQRLQVLRAEQLKLQGPQAGSVQQEPEGGFTASAPFWSSVIHARCAHTPSAACSHSTRAHPTSTKSLTRDEDHLQRPPCFLCFFPPGLKHRVDGVVCLIPG